MRSVDIVARVLERERDSKCARGALSRPKARRVGSPAIKSSICAPKLCIVSSFSAEALWVKRPIKAIKIGIRGTTIAAMKADQKSRKRIVARAKGVTVAVRTNWGR